MPVIDSIAPIMPITPSDAVAIREGKQNHGQQSAPRLGVNR